MIKNLLVVRDSCGLHARPAQLFCEKAKQFSADIQVRNATTNSEFYPAKSILSVLALGVEQGNEIEILADGKDETQAIQELMQLIKSDFAEGE